MAENYIYQNAGYLGTVHLHYNQNNGITPYTTSMSFEFQVIKATETASTVTYKLNTLFYYNGYQHYVPYQYGMKVFSSATSSGENMEPINGAINVETVGTTDLPSASFTIEKAENEMKILPYFRIGYYRYDFHTWDHTIWDNHIFPGQNYGLLCLYGPNVTTADGKTSRDPAADFMYSSDSWWFPTADGGSSNINQSIIFAGENMKTATYSNAVLTVPARGELQVFVADGQRTYRRASGLWVYDNDRHPRQVASITRYDDNRQPQTTYC